MTIRAVARLAGFAAGGAAVWTATALAVPEITTGSATALVVTGTVAVVVAVRPGRRRPAALLTAAGTALLIFLVISSALPAVPGFVAHDHPPIFTDVTRMTDPVTELAVALLLVMAAGADTLRTAWRARHRRRPPPSPGSNDMVVEPSV